MPVEHYENFPVASLLLPRRLREPVEAIYAFARSADDIADEGDASPVQRLTQLDAYREALDEIDRGARPGDPMFARLAQTVRTHRLPTALLRDLLDAFTQDITQHRYENFCELRNYCRHSADPVGRLLLHLYRQATPDNLRRSDAICSALQLVNFLQDVALDWAKGRIYLPADERARFEVAEEAIAAGQVDEAWRALMRFQVQRARRMLREGAPLAHTLPGRIGLELRLVVQGGLRILELIEAVDYDVFQHRPQLTKRDWLLMGWRGLILSPLDPPEPAAA